jgi:hypothetical protein
LSQALYVSNSEVPSVKAAEALAENREASLRRKRRRLDVKLSFSTAIQVCVDRDVDVLRKAKTYAVSIAASLYCF